MESMAEGKILAVCVREKKGQQKRPVGEIRLIPGHGIEGAVRAGDRITLCP